MGGLTRLCPGLAVCLDPLRETVGGVCVDGEGEGEGSGCRSVEGLEARLDDPSERIAGFLEELAQETFRNEVTQAVEELDIGGGCEENYAQRAVPRKLDRAEVPQNPVRDFEFAPVSARFFRLCIASN